MAHGLALPVLRPGLFCLADLAKQVIFLFLKLAVAGLQGLVRFVAACCSANAALFFASASCC